MLNRITKIVKFSKKPNQTPLLPIRRALEVWIGIILCFWASPALSKEYVEEIEKDYPLRSIGHLQVTNPKGDITIQGWALDKVRIKVRKTVQVDSPEKAKRLLELADYSYQVADGNIQITTLYGKGLTIQDRLRENDSIKSRLDLQIFAPSNLKLKIWTVEGRVQLKAWNHQAEIRTNSGSIKIEGVKAEKLSILCASCPIQLRNVRSSLNCIGGTGAVDLANIQGKSVYVETQSGTQKLSRIVGDQLYSSQSGRIEGQSLSGRVEFHSSQGMIDFREISGFLSGGVESGDISIQVREWNFLDKAFIEAGRGNIQLTLPRRFSGNVDIWSLQGKAFAEFPIEKAADLVSFGPEPSNHLVGRISEGGELLKVFTEIGDIQVLKGKL
jgi:DUF4097 and DUF4098 domain-containing protein YvlB